MGIAQFQKINSCGFCSISSHRTKNCALKKGTGTEISGNDLTEYLQKNYPFKSIEFDQSCNIYRSNINAKINIKHMRCQYLYVQHH